MKLEELLKIGRQQLPKRSRTVTHLGDVMISLKKDKTRAIITVYNNPDKCDLTKKDIWMPIFVEKKGRLYIVFGEKGEGYKAISKHKSNIGVVQTRNEQIINYIKKFHILDNVSFHQFRANWKWDYECSKPFIDLSEPALNTIKGV